MGGLARAIGYLGAWQDVWVGLYPRDDLAQDDPVCKHVHLRQTFH